MESQSRNRYAQIRTFSIPGWAVPLFFLAGMAMFVLMFFVGLAMFVVLVPLGILIVGYYQLKAWLGRRGLEKAPSYSGHTGEPQTIETEYSVIENQPDEPRSDRSN